MDPRRAQAWSGQGRGQSPPVAMLGGIVEGIGNSLKRIKEGTKDLMGNAKKLGSLK